jgi:hypothetical protein
VFFEKYMRKIAFSDKIGAEPALPLEKTGNRMYFE